MGDPQNIRILTISVVRVTRKAWWGRWGLYPEHPCTGNGNAFNPRKGRLYSLIEHFLRFQKILRRRKKSGRERRRRKKEKGEEVKKKERGRKEGGRREGGERGKAGKGRSQERGGGNCSPAQGVLMPKASPRSSLLNDQIRLTRH